MERIFSWPIAPVVAAAMLLGVLLAGCQVTLHGVDGRPLGQVTVDPENVSPGVKSGSSSSNETLLR